MRLVVSVAFIVLVGAPAIAATITLRPQTPDRPNVVIVEGPVVAADWNKFAVKTASLRSAIVAFISDNGSSASGARLGEIIHRKGFSTVVPDGRRCASACALAWLGGVKRFIGVNAGIRFHADGAASSRNVIVTAYLTKIGLS